MHPLYVLLVSANPKISLHDQSFTGHFENTETM